MKTFSENYNMIINNNKLKWSCRSSSFEVLFSGLASQSFRDPMRKSGSCTASSHPHYLSCDRWYAIYFCIELCPNSISSLSSRRC